MCIENEVSTDASIGPVEGESTTIARPAKNARAMRARARGGPARGERAGRRSRRRPRQPPRRRRSGSADGIASIFVDHRDAARRRRGFPRARAAARSRTSSTRLRRCPPARSRRGPPTIACTMGSPRPKPPVCRLRPGSERANRSKIRLRSAVGIPAPVSRIQITASRPRRCTPASIVSVSPVCCTAFSITASSATASRSASASTVASSVVPSCHRRGVAVHRRTASTTSVLHVDRHRVRPSRSAELARSRSRSAESPEPHQLVGDHRGVLRDRGVRGLSLDQLGVAERDRDRRAKLVRRVLHEPPLPLEQAHVVHRDALRFLGGRQATPRVPHHRARTSRPSAAPR